MLKMENTITTITTTDNNIVFILHKTLKYDKQQQQQQHPAQQRWQKSKMGTITTMYSMPAIIKCFIILQLIITITTMQISYCQCSVSVNNNNNNNNFTHTHILHQQQQQQQQQQYNNINSSSTIYNEHLYHLEAFNSTTLLLNNSSLTFDDTVSSAALTFNSSSLRQTLFSVMSSAAADGGYNRSQQQHLATDNYIANLLNRENILKEHNNNFNTNSIKITKSAIAAAATTTTTKIPIIKSSSCSTCIKMREQARIENLESIKFHILTRLNLTQLPNITVPRQVPNNILENFFKTFHSDKDKKHNHNRMRQRQQQQFIFDHIADNSDIEHDDADMPDVVATSDMADELLDISEMQRDQQQQQQQQHIVQQLQGVEKLNAGAISLDNDDFLAHYDDNDDEFDENWHDDDWHEDGFFSNDKSIYIFPKLSTRLRHNRKSADVINFQFGKQNDVNNIRRIKLHIYIRGYAWTQQNSHNSRSHHHQHHQANDLTIHVYRVEQSLSFMNVTNSIKMKAITHAIPNDQGEWIEIDLTKQLKRFWLQHYTQDEPLQPLQLIIKGALTWMRPYIVTSVGKNKPLSMHIELVSSASRLRRRRSTSLDCRESDNEDRCCRYPLKVNFTSFGWHFVVAPTSFDAYFCNGKCNVGYLEQYTHTHIASLTTSATPCCSPTKMSPLSLLYFNLEQNLVLSTIPNMSVEKCSCS